MPRESGGTALFLVAGMRLSGQQVLAPWEGKVEYVCRLRKFGSPLC